MGRKNGSTAGKRGGGRPQARKRGPEEPRRKPRRPGVPPPIPVEKMVMPTGRCGRKLIFGSEEDAQVALRQAQLNRRRNGQGYVEERYYHHQTCGGFHLTSRDFREKEDRQ